MFLIAVAVSPAQTHTPAVGSGERTAILNAVRPFEGGSKAKFTIEVMKTDGKFAYFQGRTQFLQEWQESPEYYLRKTEKGWIAFGKFDPYHEGQAAGWLQAYDFRLLKQANFPPALVPEMYRANLKKGWFTYGLGFQASGMAPIALTDAQIAAIDGASYAYPAIVKGYKSFQVAAVKDPRKK